jgi:hypothetical protein
MIQDFMPDDSRVEDCIPAVFAPGNLPFELVSYDYVKTCELAVTAI